MNKKQNEATSSSEGLIKETVRDVINEFVDFSEIVKPTTYENPLTILMPISLREGLIRTYPADKTIQYVRDYFNLSDEQVFKLRNGRGMEKIMVRIMPNDNNMKLIEKAMNFCGYFLAFPKEKEIKEGEPISLQFEPKIQEEDKEIRKEEKYLFHLTPQSHIFKILKIGLSPRSTNSMFNYPERVYMLRASAGESAIYELGKQLYDADENFRNSGVYAVITIDISKIPESVKLHNDPNYPYSIYTTSNISPDAIVDVNRIDF